MAVASCVHMAGIVGATACIERNRVFTRCEIAGISKEVPPVRLLVSVLLMSLVSVGLHGNPLWISTAELTTHPSSIWPIPFSSGNGIIQREREVMPLVEIRIAIVRIRIQIVLRSWMPRAVE